VLGTTLDYLRGLRIRYVEPRPDAPAGVANIADYRDLYASSFLLLFVGRDFFPAFFAGAFL
jgi:hypothetical protein